MYVRARGQVLVCSRVWPSCACWFAIVLQSACAVVRWCVEACLRFNHAYTLTCTHARTATHNSTYAHTHTLKRIFVYDSHDPCIYNNTIY